MNSKSILIFIAIILVISIGVYLCVANGFFKQESTMMQYINKIVKGEEIAKKSGIPVLMYHSVGEESYDIYHLKLSKFKSQMRYLRKNKYMTLSIEEYKENLDKKFYEGNQVLLTFDDGYKDFYTNVYPILKKYNYKATIFISTGLIDQPGYLTRDQLKEIMASGLIDIGGHGNYHEKVKCLNIEKIRGIISHVQSYLKELCVQNISVYAHPYGNFKQEVIDVLKEECVILAFSSEPGLSSANDNPYILRRVFVNSKYSMKTFKSKLVN